LRKLWKSLVVVAATASFQGCASCSIFYSDPWWCAPQNAAVVAVVAVSSPYLYASEKIDTFQRNNEEAKSEMAAREAVIASDDVKATLNCLAECATYYTLEDRQELKRLSAQRVIEWWGDNPEPEQLPLLMMAHAEIASQAWYGDDLPTAEDHYLRAAALAADPRIVEGALSERYLSGYQFRDGVVHDYDAQYIQKRLQVINYHLRHGQEPAVQIINDCRPIGPWPSAWHANDDANAAAEVMTDICRDAYKDVTWVSPYAAPAQ